MTVKEVIKKVDGLRRNNNFTIEDKMRWLNQCEAKIQIDCLLMPHVEVVYDYTADAEEELIVKMPHDEIYVYYICAKIDEALGETALYNDTIAQYNDVQRDYQKWLIRTVDPKHNAVNIRRDAPVIFQGDDVNIKIYGLPIDDAEVTEAKVCISQRDGEVWVTTEIFDVTVEQNVLSFDLTAAETYALKKGRMDVGFDITAGGYRYKKDSARRFYVQLAPELEAIAAGNAGNPVDASLTIFGRAADAGVVGGKIIELTTIIGELRNELELLKEELGK